MEPSSTEWSDWVRDLRASDREAIEKLAAYFDTVTHTILQGADREAEAAHAMGDREAAVKQRIVSDTVRTARRVFATGYHLATGGNAWDDQERR